ncbi:MAG: YjcQ family protein [Peptococcus niger]
MEEFRTIYRILKILREAMEYEEFDIAAISPDSLGISKPKWEQLMAMLVKNGYIEGVTIIPLLGRPAGIKLSHPQITLKGLEYLQENSMMKKAANLAKGIADII